MNVNTQNVNQWELFFVHYTKLCYSIISCRIRSCENFSPQSKSNLDNFQPQLHPDLMQRQQIPNLKGLYSVLNSSGQGQSLRDKLAHKDT